MKQNKKKTYAHHKKFFVCRRLLDRSVADKTSTRNTHLNTPHVFGVHVYVNACCFFFQQSLLDLPFVGAFEKSGTWQEFVYFFFFFFYYGDTRQ